MHPRPQARIDGFAPIADYAVLGDGRTAALVARDGCVDWWPVPTIDAPPMCAAILDPGSGGHLLLAPVGEASAERHYLEDTNVLETTYRAASGEVRVTVALDVGSAGRLPWTELAFRVEAVAGSVPMRWEICPGNRFGSASPWATTARGRPVLRVGDQSLVVVAEGVGEPEMGPHGVGGRWTAEAPASGTQPDRMLLGVVVTDAQPLYLPSAAEIDRRLDRTAASWRRWTGLLEDAGRWNPAVRRSALALKTLVAEETGAIAAAATTSLPEGMGGTKNWDYRYAWVRDSSFTLDAFIRLDLHEEVQGAVAWLLDAIRRNDLQIFYSLGGGVPAGQAEIDVPGYRGSRPVRSGNGASAQSQLGVYGDLFDTLHRYCEEGHVLDPDTGRVLAGLADRCCDRWRNKDSGIWELGDLQHYTVSKMGCWVALDRAVRLADDGQVEDRHRDRWAAEAAEVHAWVDEHCWSEEKGSYTFYAGTEALDAAALLAARTGFDRGKRLAGTVEAVTVELARGPLVYRYSGADNEEGAFVACSFWLVDALTYLGRLDEAEARLEELLALASDVGLYSEQMDPSTGAFLGNTPQGLSHLALINAAHGLHRARTVGSPAEEG